MYQATKRLPINPSPLTQQPTNPTAKPGQVLLKGSSQATTHWKANSAIPIND